MKKTLAIIAPTFNQMKCFLPAFVNCLISNIEYENRLQKFKCDDFVAYIGNDGESKDGTREYMQEIIKRYPENFIYFETKERKNKFGHNVRQEALNMCNEEIVMFQNVDNLICCGAVKIITDIYKENKCDIIINAIAHSYNNFEFFSGKEFAPNKTDFSNFSIRTELAKKIGIDVNSYAADAVFCKKIKQVFTNLNVITINKILSIHQ